MSHRSSIKITNSFLSEKRLILEPWAEEFQILPGDTFEFVAESEIEGSFEIDFYEDNIAVFAWAGSTVEVFATR